MSGNYVINIGRQLGSGGKEIGEKLAARLGINFYDKELINLASEESDYEISFYFLVTELIKTIRRSRTAETFPLSENIRPISRQFRFFLFQEPPAGTCIPQHLVIFAFTDIRTITERISPVSP